MGATIYTGIYPKECNNPKVIPYLSCDKFGPEFNGKRLSPEFFDKCREYGKKDKENQCFVFTTGDSRLCEFAGLQCVPEEMSEYIMTIYEDEPDGIFIVWVK